MAVAESIAEILCQSGYTTSAEFNKTLADRKWFMRWADGHRTHHLHVVVHSGNVWHERIRFRDALRSSTPMQKPNSCAPCADGLRSAEEEVTAGYKAK